MIQGIICPSHLLGHKTELNLSHLPPAWDSKNNILIVTSQIIIYIVYMTTLVIINETTAIIGLSGKTKN